MTRRTRTPILFTLTFLLASVSASQEWPAGVSAAADGPGKGRMTVTTGFDLSVKSGAAGAELRRLWRVLPAVVRLGVSRNVEVIGTWRGGLVARAADGEGHSDWGDPSLFTKISLTDSGAPVGAGVMFGFKIPSTRYLPHRLGTDATDLYFRLLVTGRSGPLEFRVNGGAAIIGDPLHTGSQDDLLTASSMIVIRAASRWTVFGELAGFTGPKEDDDKLQFRGGAAFGAGFGSVALYGNAQLAGTRADFGTAFEGTASWGFGLSVTHLIVL